VTETGDGTPPALPSSRPLVTIGPTAAEQRVAVLVAAGRTNREVAAELFLGERTVASP